MASTKVLVTGGAGFLGGNVCRALESHDFAIRVFDFSPERLKPLEERGIETEAGDCCDAEAVQRAVTGVDAVFHLVAAPEYASKETHERVTIGGVKTLAAAMKQAGVKRLLYISSTKAAVSYAGHYGTSKAKAEAFLHDTDLDYTVFRPALLYGPGEVKLSKSIKFVAKHKFVPVVGNGRYDIWPIHAEDLGNAMVAALEREAAVGKTYDVCGPTRVNFNELTDMIAAHLGKKVWKLRLPLWLCQLIAWVLSKTTHAPFISVDQVHAVRAGNAVPDMGPARRDLDFNPRSFEDGLREHMKTLGFPTA